MSALVGVIMGSKSDWATLSHTVEMLDTLGIPHEVRVVSAHRTPDLLFQYAEQAADRGIAVIIAGAGGAAHLPGMCAAKTHLPVLGVIIHALRRRLTAVDRADARRHSGRHPGHRQGRRGECRPARRQHPRSPASAVPFGAEEVPSGTDRFGAGQP